jgi:mono/diheme cytochrome c family protein
LGALGLAIIAGLVTRVSAATDTAESSDAKEVSTAEDKREQYVQFALKNRGKVKIGRDLFLGGKLSCIHCHGRPGDGGGYGPDLAGVCRKLDREQLARKILFPRPVMPSGFERQMTPEQFASLVSFLEEPCRK